jgi:hypothetical protein
MSEIDQDPPREVGQLLEGLFRKKRREPVLKVHRLRQSWPGIVGEALARVTWPSRIARGVLWIAAIDTGWAFNLQFVKADLLNAVQTFLDSQDIRDIRYKAGEIPGREPPQSPAPGVAPDAAAPATDSATPAALAASSGSTPAAARAGRGSELTRARPRPGQSPAAESPAGAPPTAEPAPPIADPALRERFLRAAAKLKARRAGAGAAVGSEEPGSAGPTRPSESS